MEASKRQCKTILRASPSSKWQRTASLMRSCKSSMLSACVKIDASSARGQSALGRLLNDEDDFVHCRS